MFEVFLDEVCSSVSVFWLTVVRAVFEVFLDEVCSSVSVFWLTVVRAVFEVFLDEVCSSVSVFLAPLHSLHLGLLFLSLLVFGRHQCFFSYRLLVIP